MKQSLTIGWLYPVLMSTYGDRGNIITLQKRCEWRGIDVVVKRLNEGFSEKDLTSCDLLFMGGAQDRQQKIVSEDLSGKAESLSQMINDGVPGLYICGAYQFLGKYYKEADGTIIKGLGILDVYTENPGAKVPRLIGNIAIELNKDVIADQVGSGRKSELKPRLVGFENHGGRTYLGSEIRPLGSVVVGLGNNGEDKTEGAVYKNSFGSYFHGPILPKNPLLADHLISLTLAKKYKKEVVLESLNDEMETTAHKKILEKLSV